ncbi:MAG: hypothetical protein ACOC5D_04690 [Thermoplasmatota archaeon]
MSKLKFRFQDNLLARIYRKIICLLIAGDRGYFTLLGSIDCNKGRKRLDANKE